MYLQHVPVRSLAVCIYFYNKSITTTGFNTMSRDVKQSRQKEIICWHSTETGWPVNANSSNSLVIGTGALLARFRAV